MMSITEVRMSFGGSIAMADVKIAGNSNILGRCANGRYSKINITCNTISANTRPRVRYRTFSNLSPVYPQPSPWPVIICERGFVREKEQGTLSWSEGQSSNITPSGLQNNPFITYDAAWYATMMKLGKSLRDMSRFHLCSSSDRSLGYLNTFGPGRTADFSLQANRDRTRLITKNLSKMRLPGKFDRNIGRERKILKIWAYNEIGLNM